MRRRRYQKGSLQARRHGKKRVWVVQYYDTGGHHRYHTLGRMCDLTKSQAEERQNDFMRSVNGGEAASDRVRPVLLGEFVDQIYLPYQRGKWKRSTKGTSESRIRAHIIKDLGNVQMEEATPTILQSYLDGKAATLGFSVVDHLRWDLTSIWDLAIAERTLTANPARALYTPASAKKGDAPAMTAAEVEKALGAVGIPGEGNPAPGTLFRTSTR